MPSPTVRQAFGLAGWEGLHRENDHTVNVGVVNGNGNGMGTLGLAFRDMASISKSEAHFFFYHLHERALRVAGGQKGCDMDPCMERFRFECIAV